MYHSTATIVTIRRDQGMALLIAALIHALLVVYFVFHGFVVPKAITPVYASALDLGTELVFGLPTPEIASAPVTATPSAAVVHSAEASAHASAATTKSDLLAMLDGAWAVRASSSRKDPATSEQAVTCVVPNDAGSRTNEGKEEGQVQLKGFRVKQRPLIKDEPAASGKVVMDIWVDPNGTVIRAEQNTSLSTTLDQALVDIAERAALACAFYPNAAVTCPQKGNITFVFELE